MAARLVDFKFGQRGLGFQLRTIVVIADVVIDAAAKLVVPISLNADDQLALLVSRAVQLQLIVTNKVGVTSWDITGIEASLDDGVTWFTVETYGAAVSVAANGQYAAPLLTKQIMCANKLRLKTANVVASAGNTYVLNAALKVASF